MKERLRRCALVALNAATYIVLVHCPMSAIAAAEFDPLVLQGSAAHVMLYDTDPLMRATAAMSLWPVKCCSEQTVVSELTQALDDPSEGVKVGACMSLRHYGPAAEGAVPRLAELVGQSGPQVQREALAALAAIGPKARAATKEVHMALESPVRAVRVYAAAAAVTISGQSEPYLETLTDALKPNEPASLRADAVDRISACGALAENALPSLIEALDGSDVVSALAAQAIGKLGLRPRESVDALLAAARRPPDVPVSYAALLALGAFPSQRERTVPVLLKVVESRGAGMDAALKALCQLDSFGDGVAVVLESLICSDDAAERFSAYVALAASNNPSPTFLGATVHTLAHDQDPGIREEALRYVGALAQSAEYGQQARVALVLAAGDSDAGVRFQAVCSLVSDSDDGSAIVLAALLHGVRDSHYEVVRCALEGLHRFRSRLSPVAEAALLQLREEYGGSQYQKWDKQYGLVPLTDIISGIIGPPNRIHPSHTGARNDSANVGAWSS